MKKVAITFGPDHDVHHTDIAERISEGYVVIEAPTRDKARDIAFAIFGRRWAFDYDLSETDWESDNAKKGYHPAGELLRIAWLDFGRQASMVAAIEDSYDTDDLDSDEEVERLDVVRELLENIIDYTPAHERDWTPEEES